MPIKIVIFFARFIIPDKNIKILPKTYKAFDMSVQCYIDIFVNVSFENTFIYHVKSKVFYDHASKRNNFYWFLYQNLGRTSIILNLGIISTITYMYISEIFSILYFIITSKVQYCFWFFKRKLISSNMYTIISFNWQTFSSTSEKYQVQICITF